MHIINFLSMHSQRILNRPVKLPLLEEWQWQSPLLNLFISSISLMEYYY